MRGGSDVLARLRPFGLLAAFCWALSDTAAGRDLAALSSATFNAEAGKIYALRVRARAEGASWETRGAESATLRVELNGRRVADVVTFYGDRTFDYGVLLGELPAGKIRVEAFFDRERSRAKNARPIVESLTVESASPADPRYPCWSRSPVLYGPGYNLYSDVPLLLYCEYDGPPEARSMDFTTIWSNEDGGTGRVPPQLLAQWGRVTDIELMESWRFGSGGRPVSQIYQGPGHEMLPFSGEREGLRSVYYLATENNMVSDRGEGDLRFSMVPEVYLEPVGSRESVMDAHPFTHEVSNAEMRAEGKSLPSERARGAQLEDLRRYVYVDLDCRNRGGSDALWVSVYLKGRKKPLRSDDAAGLMFVKPESMRHGWGGWRRMAVKLPGGARFEDVLRVDLEGGDGADWIVNEASGMTFDAGFAVKRRFEWKRGPGGLKEGEKKTIYEAAP